MSAHFRELFPSNKVIKFRTDFRNTIYDLFLHRKWELTTHESEWNMCWSEKDWINEVYDSLSLRNNQYVNHFRNYYERKDLLAKNMKRLKKQQEKMKNEEELKLLDITPVTFVLPLEYKLFLEEYKRRGNRVWIMKPIGKSQGKGIFLFSKISQIKSWSVGRPAERSRAGAAAAAAEVAERNRAAELAERNNAVAAAELEKPPEGDPSAERPEQYIVQEYIPNPLLIGGKKFDIRLYVLIVCYSPLTIYLYRSGFARFAHTYFKNEKNHMTDVTMHLTNVSIQKNAEGYDDNVGGKWFVRELFLYMSSRYGYDRVMQLIGDIENCIIQSFLAVHKIIINDRHCFELYGFDILIDSNLKPWLIEVNSSPSLSANTQEDYTLKFNMLDELMCLINLEQYPLPETDRVGDFDCIYRAGRRVLSPRPHNFFSRLGAQLSGTEHLKQMAKDIKRGMGTAGGPEKGGAP
ncbi:tubulin tyrosine ligase-like protein 1, putative [Plasmodium vivax]|uniref:Tubulin--tyrosine ligase-like protein 9 n=1 Tax=Plasmodium vivax TaxID=5855 RepID=A0A1G4HE95_PLAVI|nr:tubulin tyrosine ligase-like protein 1, putative [Plasmodium vivax]SCO73214.1 tubulin tyrosine ligase-like protein 1, putative [Plasmodium vivax]